MALFGPLRRAGRSRLECPPRLVSFASVPQALLLCEVAKRRFATKHEHASSLTPAFYVHRLSAIATPVGPASTPRRPAVTPTLPYPSRPSPPFLCLASSVAASRLRPFDRLRATAGRPQPFGHPCRAPFTHLAMPLFPSPLAGEGRVRGVTLTPAPLPSRERGNALN